MLYPYNAIAYYVAINTMIFFKKLKTFIIRETCQKDTKASSKWLNNAHLQHQNKDNNRL